MNKSLTLISLTLVLVTLPGIRATALPGHSTSTQVISTLIQDPLLREGWSRLNHHRKAIGLWDGQTLSGHDLAQFALDNGIPVVWGSKDICHGNSCSLKYCRGDLCTYEDGKPGADPIYINPSFQAPVEERMTIVVESMAHEIYHRLQPYGRVKITLYEEYSAYYVSTHITGTAWANFKGYDPLQPACLKRWFKDYNLLYGYQGVDLYTQSVAATVDHSAQSCTLAGDSPSQAAPEAIPTSVVMPDYTLDCQVTLEGQVACQQIETTGGSSGQPTTWVPSKRK